MPRPENKSRYAFDRSGNYRIRVEGFLDKSWSERLGDMSVLISGRGDQRKISVLTGLVRDQAELIGIVKTLCDLCLTLLSVEYIDEEQISRGTGTA